MTIVHILRHGYAVCGLKGLPGDWPEGHKWVAPTDEELKDPKILGEVNCQACLHGGPVGGRASRPAWQDDPAVAEQLDPKPCKGCDANTTKPNRFEVDGEPFCLDCGPGAVAKAAKQAAAVGKKFEAMLRGDR